MYTGAPTPIRYLGWPFLMYRSIRPTGKMTPALADREVLVDFFFPPRLDMVVAPEADQQVHCEGKKHSQGHWARLTTHFPGLLWSRQEQRTGTAGSLLRHLCA